MQRLAQLRNEFKQTRIERKMLRDYHAAGPTVQQELFAVLRRQG